MSSWLRSLLARRSGADAASPVLELLVLEGVDAGEVFTVDGDEVVVGRRPPSGRRGRGILLRDTTVSARQAVIRRRGGDFTIRHLDGATNPTLIDGRPARADTLRHGSRIRIGRVEIEARERSGLAISHLTQVFSASARQHSAHGEREATSGGTDAPTEELVVPPAPRDDETTAIRPVVTQLGRLVVERGLEVAPDHAFPIWSTRTLVGRASEADVRIAEMGVSRRHAELVNDGGTLMLVHHSKVNPTLLNGRSVQESEPVADGDLVQLADSVVLRVELLDADARRRVAETENERRRRSLKQRMEQRHELDRRIEEDYSVEGSFLDVDVVNSYGMKAETTRADHIVLSFERFRSFVGDVVVEMRGHVLNSNGDELMCYFESTADAVRAAAAILDRLEGFNREKNLLPSRFRFRLGIHTGRSLVDLDQGVAYSPVLDIAGHLQKLAEPDSVLLSEQTVAALPPGWPTERAGVLEREGLAYYRLAGPVA